MKHFAPILAMAAAALTAAAAPAMAQDPARIAELEDQIEEVEEEIEEVELWAQMQDAAAYIPGRASRCWTYLEMADQSRDELEALNQEFQGRADDEYRRQAEILLSDNRNAVDEYRSCFGSVAAQRYDKIAAAGVYPYEPFVARYNQLSDAYGEGDMGPRWAELNRELEALQEALEAEESGENTVAGVLASTYRTVEVLRGGQWIPARQGMQVMASDEIRTGPIGLARLEFADAIRPNMNSGPTVINIGARTHIRIDSYVIAFREANAAQAQRQGVISLIRGRVRAFTRKWGSGSLFSVRAGTTVCGVRGTEVVVSYDPDTDDASVWLDHGDAFLDLGAGEQALTPGTVSFLSGGRLTGQRPFEAAEYAERVVATAEAPDLTPQQAMATRPSVLVELRSQQQPTGAAALQPPLTLDGVTGLPSANSPAWLTDDTYVPPAERARQAAAEALRDMEAWLDAGRRGDWDVVVRHLSAELKPTVRDAVSRAGGDMSVIRREQNVPEYWRIDCLACASDQACDMFFLVSYWKDPDLYYRSHYGLTPERTAGAEDWIISEVFYPDEAEYDSGVNACLAAR